MKLSRVLLCMVPCLTLALTAEAVMSTTFNWGFGSAGNPSVGTGSPNPSGAEGVIALSGTKNRYFFTRPTPGDYGTPSGMWSLLNNSQNLADVGTMQLYVNRKASSLLDMTLSIKQFVDGGAFFPGSMTFSLSGSTFDGRVINETTGQGQWVTDTYHWSLQNFQTEAVGLTLSPTGSGAQLLVDSVMFIIDGDLVAVPEPAYTKGLAVAGLLAMAVFSLRRRTVKA